MISLEYVNTALLSMIAGLLGAMPLQQKGMTGAATVIAIGFIGWGIIVLVYALYQDRDNLYLVGDSA